LKSNLTVARCTRFRRVFELLGMGEGFWRLSYVIENKLEKPTFVRGTLISLRTRALSFPGAIAAILLAKVYWTCRERIVDTDLGWHLQNGAYLLKNHHWPNFDSYSFTAVGARWVDHSWLPEITYYLCYHWLGLRGIFLVFFLTTAALLLTVFLLCLARAEDPLGAGIVTILGGILAMVGFTPRAQNFGWLCFAAVFAILLRFSDKRKAPLWLIPVLFVFWINCHGSWPFGLVGFVIIFAAGLIRGDIANIAASPWTSTEVKKLRVTLLASIAALFANPFGWRLVVYPFDVAFRQHVNVALGYEWASVDFNDSRGVYVLVVLGTLFVLALMQRRRWRIAEVLLTAFAVFCGLKHIRFLMLTGIVLPPILAPQLGRLSTYDPRRERRLLNGMIIAVVAALVVVKFPSNRELESQIEAFFPAAAVNYLSTHPQPGNMFNQYEWGGYLEWKLPQAKTFIDSRTDIFEYRGVLTDYAAISTLREPQELLDRYQIGYILYAADSPLSSFLSRSPHWQCVFRDGQSVIYRRGSTDSTLSRGPYPLSRIRDMVCPCGACT
jgi:hypothetical protein